MNKITTQKIISFISSLLIFLQSFSPFFYISPTTIFAQEVTPTAIVTTPVEPTIISEQPLVVEPTATPTNEPTATPIITLTPEPTSAPSQIAEPTITPAPTVTETTTPLLLQWTFQNLELGKEYIFPQNSEVKLTFTKLPTPSGNIKIQEITLSEEQIKQTGSLSDKAYDITSDMKDGDFTYNLSLPIPESSKGKEVNVKFAEEISSIESAKEVENLLTKTEKSISVNNLNHFTIFIITDDNATYTGGTWIDYASQGYFENGVHYPSTVPSGQIARWTFSTLSPSGSYNVYISWSTHPNRAQAAPYVLNYDGGTTSPFIINQELMADQSTTGSYGQWSGWYKLGTAFNLTNSSNVVLSSVNNTSGTDYVIADEVLIVPNSTPTTVWIDDNYTINSKNDGHVWGYDAFATIQEGVTAVSHDGTINIAAGTYVEAGQIVINKNLSIIGADKDAVIIKPNQDTGTVNDSRGWILVNAGNSFTLKNVTLDGTGKLINIGILSHGPGTIDNCNIKNTSYNPSGPSYAGRGIAFYGADMIITNNLLQNYGRIGVYINGTNTALIEGNTMEGKGSGDHLDYAIEIEGGASAEIKNNIISNNKGVASVDGSVSAGILATTYWAPGTNVKIINNSIHDNSYGIAMGYGTGDTTTVNQFNANSFSNNTFDLDNSTNKSIDARNNTWSVVDQNNLDQIEERINHNCSNSSFVHGICNGVSDYGAGYGVVRYKNIGTPTNSGWNIRSKSATPNETPLDLDCSAIRYTNENSIAQNWTSVDGSGIKYQREVTYPSGSLAFFNAGNSLYTPFSTFGSGAGIEGQWKARVRAYVDQNNNNIVDSSEESSTWSNYCIVVLDKTVPTATISYDITALTNSDVVTTLIPSEAVTVINNGGAVSYTFTANGSITFNFIDNAGNTGTATATVSNIDKSAPSAPSLSSPTNNQNLTTHNFAFTWGSVTDINNPITYEWESSYGTGINAEGSFTSRLAYHNLSTTSVNSPGTPDNIYYWHVRAIDGVGNKSNWSTTWKVTIDTTKPGTPVINKPTAEQYFKTSPILNEWSAISDLSGIKQYTLEYYYDDGHTFSGAPYRYVTTNSRYHSPGISEQGGVTLRVRAEDNAGNIGDWSTPIHYTYDATVPTIAINNPSTGADHNKTITASSPDGVLTMSETTGTICNNTLIFSPYSVMTYSSESDNGKKVCYKSQDAAGNITYSLSSAITGIDWTIPTLVSKSEFAGWYKTAQLSTFEYSDANGIVAGIPVTCTIITEGSAQTCTISPNVCDTAGNCNTSELISNTANIDFTKPESVITFPTNTGTDSTVYVSDWSGSIQGTASDNLSGINSVQISIQNASGQYFDGASFIDHEGELLLDTVYTEGSWHYDELTSPIEGSYVIKSHAIDGATNIENTYSLTIIFDKTIPEVSISLNPIVGDASNGWYKTQPEVTLTATDTYLHGVEYQWDSQVGTWTAYSVPFKLGSEGSHVLYYRAHDKAKNYSEIGIKNIKWNKTELKNGPLNINISPNPTSESTSKVKWEAATSDTIGIDKYEVQWHLKNGDKNYTVSVGNNIREYIIDQLVEGIWEVKVTAFDASGNTKSSSTDLTVDKSGPIAPTLSIFGTADGSVSLSWSKVDGANNYIIWYGTAPGSYQYGAKVGDTQNYTVQGLGAGSYYFIVKAVDAAGNQSGDSNEVSTGAIAGAPGVAENTPAQGFTEEVLGANTITPTQKPKGDVLGTGTVAKKNPWWWPWILLLFLSPSIWFGYKKWKKSKTVTQ